MNSMRHLPPKPSFGARTGSADPSAQRLGGGGGGGGDGGGKSSPAGENVESEVASGDAGDMYGLDDID